jgi:hypothetical protein
LQAVFIAYCFGLPRCPTQPGHTDLPYHFKFLQAESIIVLRVAAAACQPSRQDSAAALAAMLQAISAIRNRGIDRYLELRMFQRMLNDLLIQT